MSGYTLTISQVTCSGPSVAFVAAPASAASFPLDAENRMRSGENRGCSGKQVGLGRYTYLLLAHPVHWLLAQDRCISCQSPRSESTNPAAVRSSSLSTTSASPKNPQSSLEKAPEEGAEEEIPPELAKALVDLFFLKIQPWLPLFHRPTFYQTYIGNNQTMRAMGDLSMDERLMFWAIFALAAKYYSAGDWARIPAPERGAQFAVNANQAYARLRLSASKSSEAYLKGCILLAFYLYTSCLRHQSWILTGVCVRMAFDLNLHRIDAIETEGNCGADEQQLTTRWMRKEGLRRIWWLVWELDRFGSILLQRPYAIDDRSVRVCLPVSDHDWFAGRRVGSAMLDREPHRVWNSLQGSENQSERAWFLVCNHLVSLAHASYQYPSNEEVGEIVRMETILNCFRLSLPPQFDIFENPPDFSNDDVSQYNWIICTNLLLLSARTSCDVARAQPEQMYTKRIQARASELVQIMNAWPSEYIKVCQPFVACTLLGPKSAFVDSNRGTPNPNPAEPTLAKEMARLGLAHFARHWNLASVLLGSSLVECTGPLQFTDAEYKTWRVFSPHPIMSPLLTLEKPFPHFSPFSQTVCDRLCRAAVRRLHHPHAHPRLRRFLRWQYIVSKSQFQ